MKKILILGAGDYQLPLIEAAKNEQYCTIVCDYNKNAVGVQLSDIFYEVSTTDLEAVFDVAQKERIDGIIGNSEAVMPVVASVSEVLGLPGNPLNSVSQLMSKQKFRALQKKCNLFSPQYKEVNSLDACINSLEKFSFPLIIKPSESSGSRGTTKIDNISDFAGIEEAFFKCKEISRNGLVVMEEYVPMASNVVIEGEVFINNGQCIFDGLFSTVRSKSATMIPMSYCFPCFLSDLQRKEVEQHLAKLFKESGIRHGEYNVELYFTQNGELFTIEINARQGGNQLPVYVEKHCGINMYKLLVTTAVDDQYYWNEVISTVRNVNHLLCHHILFPREKGRFKGIEISSEIKSFIIDEHILINKGDEIRGTEDSTSKIGYIDFEWDSIEHAMEYGCDMERYVRIICE